MAKWKVAEQKVLVNKALEFVEILDSNNKDAITSERKNLF